MGYHSTSEALGEKHSTFTEKRTEATGGESRETKEELGKIMRLHPHRTTELECLKGTTTTEVNSVPFCQCLFLLYKPLLQNSPSIGSSKITVPISTSMPHSTVQRKSAGNRTIKARGTENALEIIRNPGNSSAFL